MNREVTEFTMVRGMGVGMLKFMLPNTYMIPYKYFRLVPVLDNYFEALEFENFDFDLDIICYN